MHPIAVTSDQSGISPRASFTKSPEPTETIAWQKRPSPFIESQAMDTPPKGRHSFSINLVTCFSKDLESVSKRILYFTDGLDHSSPRSVKRNCLMPKAPFVAISRLPICNTQKRAWRGFFAGIKNYLTSYLILCKNSTMTLDSILVSPNVSACLKPGSPVGPRVRPSKLGDTLDLPHRGIQRCVRRFRRFPVLALSLPHSFATASFRAPSLKVTFASRFSLIHYFAPSLFRNPFSYRFLTYLTL